MGGTRLLMATEVRIFDPVVPAGTPANAPVVIDVSFPPMITEVITWRVPRGPSGLMGWRLTSGTGQVVPKNLGAWIITDNESGSFQLDQLHDSGSWQLTAYNTGANPHIVHLRFHVAPIGNNVPTSGPLAWLASSPLGADLIEVGAMANAPAVVDVPRSLLWPPRGR